MPDIKTPDLPESVAQATIMTWTRNDGDLVDAQEKLADIETDKVVLEIYAPSAGVLKIVKPAGSVILRGDVIASIEPGSGAKAATVAAAATEKPAPAAAGPSARKAAQELGVDPSTVKGSGKGGRVTKSDVEVAARAPTAPPATTPVGATSAPAMLLPASAGGVRRVPMSQIRQRIATRLKEVQNTAAILTTFNEVNLHKVVEIRDKFKDRFLQEHGVKLGFMSFFVKAVVEALKKYPAVNGSIEGADIVYHEYYHVGIAVDSPRGLVVPVLRDADMLTFAGVEKNIRDLGQRAKDNKLAYEDLVGGTFTITNGGTFGSMLSTPILNAPQSAILGMHAIQNRPVAEGDQVVIRPVMYLALSYDHRIIDGRDAVRFLVSIKESLEDPANLLLQL